jgi:Phage tail lysozyme
VLPTVTSGFKQLNEYFKDLEKEQGGIESFFVKVAAAASLLATPLRAIAASILVANEIGQAESDVVTGSRKSFLAREINKLILGGTDESSNTNQEPKVKNTGNPAVDFWLSQGYDLDKAIALAANEQAESSGNPSARNYGNGSQHYGLYQFDENRRRDIASGLGIDVATAGTDQQRLAAAWDMKRSGNDIGLKATTSLADATDYVNRRFEVSGEDSSRRIAIASQIASSIPSIPPSSGGNSKALSVKIDNVSIQTQATDAGGISKALTQQLQSDLGNLYYDWNDGVDY